MLASNQHGIKKTGYTYPLEAVVAKKKKNTHTHTRKYMEQWLSGHRIQTMKYNNPYNEM